MKRFSCRCIAALLLLVQFLLLFAACSPTEQPSDDTTGSVPYVDTTTPDTTAPGKSDDTTADTTHDSSADTTEESTADTTEAIIPDNTVPLVRRGEAVYTIIRSSTCTSWAQQTADAVRAELSEQTGVAFTGDSDQVQGEVDVNSTYEILIGNTNREASQTFASEGLGLYDYVIAVKENKIVILGGSDYALEVAGNEFLALAKSCEYFLPDDLSVRGTADRSPYIIGAANQKESAVEVYDIGTGVINEESRIFRFVCSEYNIAGLKFRKYKGQDVMIAAYGFSSAIMTTYPGGEVLWNTNATAQNPHSIELIPFADGSYIIAVAASTGAEVRFFDPAGENSQMPLLSIAYADAHGVLWDPLGECLWILGEKKLSKYSITRDGSTVTATPITVYTSPVTGGHDLAPVYGDTNSLWISTKSAVYKFDKTTGKFTTNYTGNRYLARAKIKGVGNFNDGSILWIIPDGKFESWTANYISFGKITGDSFALYQPKSETGAFYKVRIWSTDYQ